MVGAGPAAGGAEALLAEIRRLLDEYLAMGEDTPVAAEAQALAAAIDSGSGAGEVPGAEAGLPPGAPPEAMGEGLTLDDLGAEMGGAEPDLPAPDEGELPADMMLPQEGEPPRDTGRKSFGEANKSAEDRLKKRNRR
jgi:hypothetical protein